ncbi:MAG: hypothetical protein ACTJLK_00680 [Anaplasma sp.]
MPNLGWKAPDSRVGFADSRLMALRCGLGYSAGRTELQLELGHEMPPIKKAWGKMSTPIETKMQTQSSY